MSTNGVGSLQAMQNKLLIDHLRKRQSPNNFSDDATLSIGVSKPI